MAIVRLCRTCAHWRAHETTADQGDCRRSPPAVGMVPVTTDLPFPADALWSAWPETKPDQSCGQWEADAPAVLEPVARYAAQLEDRAERANVHTSGVLYEIAQRLRALSRGEE